MAWRTDGGRFTLLTGGRRRCTACTWRRRRCCAAGAQRRRGSRQLALRSSRDAQLSPGLSTQLYAARARACKSAHKNKTKRLSPSLHALHIYSLSSMLLASLLLSLLSHGSFGSPALDGQALLLWWRDTYSTRNKNMGSICILPLSANLQSQSYQQ